MEVDEIEAGLLEKFSSLQTVDQPGENHLSFFKGRETAAGGWTKSPVKGQKFIMCCFQSPNKIIKQYERNH